MEATSKPSCMASEQTGRNAQNFLEWAGAKQIGEPKFELEENC